MHPILAMCDPITGALGVFTLQSLCGTRPSRIVPRTQILLRRNSHLYLDAALGEVSDFAVDLANAIPVTPISCLFVMLLLAAVVALRSHRLPLAHHFSWEYPI